MVLGSGTEIATPSPASATDAWSGSMPVVISTMRFIVPARIIIMEEKTPT